MTDDATVMGPRIKELRTRLGMTQVDFAVSVGVTRSHLTNAENGQATLALDKMIAMAREHGVSLDWLTGLTDRPAADLRGAELLRAFRGMTDDAKAGLLSVVRSMAPQQDAPAPTREAAPRKRGRAPPRPIVGGSKPRGAADDCDNVVPIPSRQVTAA